MMKHILMSTLCIALLATPAVSAEKKTVLKTEKDKVSYMLGVDMGSRMKAELER